MCTKMLIKQKLRSQPPKNKYIYTLAVTTIIHLHKKIHKLSKYFFIKIIPDFFKPSVIRYILLCSAEKLW